MAAPQALLSKKLSFSVLIDFPFAVRIAFSVSDPFFKPVPFFAHEIKLFCTFIGLNNAVVPKN